jgi:hypothetical protein
MAGFQGKSLLPSRFYPPHSTCYAQFTKTLPQTGKRKTVSAFYSCSTSFEKISISHNHEMMIAFYQNSWFDARKFVENSEKTDGKAVMP